ncbi:MAG: flagellar basal-body rod protein FlgF [Clostridia bacterium]|nr:flagellar basal-body rod protein FlgF [Clostridia bacterium]
MIRGLYTAGSGMVVEANRNDTIANNLANVNTNGYKKDIATFRSFPEMLIRRLNDPGGGPGANLAANQFPIVGTLGTGAVVDEIYTAHTIGSLKQTGAGLDLALGSDGYFVVNTAQGERYTRNGSFKLDAQGYMVTSEGNRVMGQAGAIRIQGGNVSVDESGIITVDGNRVDTLRVVDFADKRALTKTGDSLFSGNGAAVPQQVKVLQGFQETSNVNPITEMVNMITVMRSYEANQKAVQSHDNLLGKAVNEVGRLG